MPSRGCPPTSPSASSPSRRGSAPRRSSPRASPPRPYGKPPPPSSHAASAEVPELIPYGPDAKKVLELTFREALRLGHNYIGTEHILLALLEFENGEGVLSGLGVTKEATEADVAKALQSIVQGQEEE